MVYVASLVLSMIIFTFGYSVGSANGYTKGIEDMRDFIKKLDVLNNCGGEDNE